MGTLDTRLRIRLKNVLFCADFSPAAEVALPYAVDLARHFRAKLYALYVRNPDDYIIVFPEGGSIPPGFTASQARKKLNGLLEPLEGLERQVLVEEGEVWPTIASVIEENEIDLVVAGTKGRTGIAKLVLGSRAEEIFRRASCPVLTVGPHSPARLPHIGFQEILYATNFGSAAAEAARYAMSLAQEYQASLTLLHVIAGLAAEDAAQREKLIAAAQKALRSLLPTETQLWREPLMSVQQGPPAETILELAGARKADLIVMGVRHPVGISASATHLPTSVAHRIVSGANCPVLTVRG